MGAGLGGSGPGSGATSGPLAKCSWSGVGPGQEVAPPPTLSALGQGFMALFGLGWGRRQCRGVVWVAAQLGRPVCGTGVWVPWEDTQGVNFPCIAAL